VTTDVLTIAARRRAAQAALARSTASAAQATWARIDRLSIGRSWLRLLAEPLALLTAAQLQVAQTADAYVAQTLGAQGVAEAAEGTVWARSLAGIASDGRRLDTLLYQPAIDALTLIGAGATPAQALAAGALRLDMIVRTQIADAGRVATGVGIAARPRVGYTRVLTPPSCSRCAILAGKFYRWSMGFQRHPRCDCVHVPTTRAASGGLVTSPRGYFDSLSAAEQNRVFTRAGAQSIRDGADMGQVVNARRGMTSAGTTTEATTRRGGAPRGRLMPEEIYRRAGSREEALELLRQHRYLI
jgi:hypothetical protein